MKIQINDKWRIVPYGKGTLQGWTIEELKVAKEDSQEHMAGESYWYNDQRHWYSSKLETALSGAMNILVSENEDITNVKECIQSIENFKAYMKDICN